MFGGYYFGRPYFADGPVLVVVPPTPTVVVTTIVPDCRQRACDLVSDLGSYTLDSPTTPRVVQSEDCRSRECVLTPDIEIYTLEDRLAFNGTPLSFVEQCPTGYYCAPGTFPKTFTYPPGTFTIPLPPINTGFPIIVQLQGCSSNVSIVLPATATQAQVDAAGQQVINQVAAQQAQCDAIKSAGPLLPISIQLSDIFTYACSGVPMSLAIHGSSTPSRLPITFIVSNQPSFLTASQSPSTLFMAGTPSTIGVYNFGVTATAPGTPPGSGSKSYTLNVIGIATASPLPNGNVGSPYSQVLDGSSIPGSLTWSVSVGVLPDGLSLDASTGEIAGTPTTDIIDTFTVLATNGEIGCEKEFDLEILPPSTGWPHFLFTDLFANNTALSAATINGYDKLAGLPVNGTDLGAIVTTNWTVTGLPTAYTISYQCDSVAGPGDVGNWRVTIDNLNIVAATLSFPLGVYVYVNGVQIYFYEVDSTTGPLFVDTAIANGDTLSFILAVDGNAALAGSHQVTVTVTQLP